MPKKKFLGLLFLLLIGLIGISNAALTHIETIHVFAKGPNAPEYITIPTSSSNLEKGGLYKVEVSGKYYYGNSLPWGIADAEWVNREGNPVDGQHFGEWYKMDTTEPWLDLMINEKDCDWGTFQSNHLYAKYITGEGEPITFRIKDSCDFTLGEGCYYDNSGYLTVDIYKESTEVPEFPSLFIPLIFVTGIIGFILITQRNL